MDTYLNITTREIYSMLAENEMDRLRSDEIKTSRNQKQNQHPNNWTRLDFYREVFADKQIDGFLMQYPHGRVICQAQRSYYYRGENQVFGSSKSSLNRKLSTIKNKNQALIEELVAYMRIADFFELLLKFDHAQDFMRMPLSFNNQSISSGIDILYEQIAQHYGFETPWLDITSDFEIALFFACCKFNTILQKWEPLNNQDFNIKHETQFGVIFQQATLHPNNFLPDDLQEIQILPVGFQPFMRCHMQSSYVALMDKSHSLQKENTFKKLRFKHNEELCNYIYKKMDGGKKIYPHEGLNIMEEEIEDIKKRKVFTIDTFEFTLKEEKFNSLNREETEQLLMANGYEITNASNHISRKKIEQINQQYFYFDIEKTYKIQLSTRLVSIHIF